MAIFQILNTCTHLRAFSSYAHTYNTRARVCVCEESQTTVPIVPISIVNLNSTVLNLRFRSEKERGTIRVNKGTINGKTRNEKRETRNEKRKTRNKKREGEKGKEKEKGNKGKEKEREKWEMW